MSKYEVQQTMQIEPMKVLIYGVEGIGKTTFASKFPDPIFIDTEGSTGFINARKLPNPTSWTMLLDELEDIKSEPRGKTLIIDTLDWAERLAKKYLMDKNKWAAIDSTNYGSRYVALSDEIGKLLNKLTEIKDIGINVVLTAHAETKKHELPDEMGQYDKYTLKLEKRDAGLAKEWADMILFFNYKTTIISDSKSNSKKATGGQRVMYTTHKPAWDAKNRLGLPDELPIDFEAIRELFEAKTGMSTTQIKSESTQKTQTQQMPLPEEPPVIETEPEPVEAQAAPVFNEEIPSSIPQSLADLMTVNHVTTDEIMQVIYIGGFMPQGTPLENVPAELWGHLASNWDKVLNMLETQIRK
ncbi:ATP-binding protein [Ligilactobacillus salivarius]|uniref:ATP-binding protein n=1 Tax=Ligilactobacillus salivarius TaxID=1624 RepID=UPI0021513BD3|nr:ATP-binding protein [Ligilactobacillus salivarius]MDH4960340.1 ATP-binding protein [Ligilactobacillus salivarius]UUY23869.1 ATP-binding protein [Ligilactobacillus salivarius]